MQITPKNPVSFYYEGKKTESNVCSNVIHSLKSGTWEQEDLERMTGN